MGAQIQIPQDVNRIVETLEAAGYEAWAVGGCVRDSLLGIPPKDWDICTNALPEQILSCFPGLRTLEVGKKHGTITVIPENTPYEITTYRTDGPYSDSRRPDHVRFVPDIEQDLLRRDFTVNAMAYHPKRGLADYSGGQADLKNMLIRCVGDPYTRFKEDALRILRALRFAATYGFSLDTQTAQAAHELRDSLNRIAPERIQMELSGILCGHAVQDILSGFSDIIFAIIPELAGTHLPHYYKNGFCSASPPSLEKRVPAAAGGCFDTGTTLCPALTLLLKNLGADTARTVLTRLRYDSRTIQTVCELIRLHSEPIPPQASVIKRYLNRLGPDVLKQLLEVQHADIIAQKKGAKQAKLKTLQQVKTMLLEILAGPPCWEIRHLAVTGQDIMALGIPQGRQVGEVLSRLLDKVMDGELENVKSALLADLAVNS